MDSIFQGRTRCTVNPQESYLPVYLYLLLHRGILLVITEVRPKREEQRKLKSGVCALGVYPIGAEAQRTGNSSMAASPDGPPRKPPPVAASPFSFSSGSPFCKVSSTLPTWTPPSPTTLGKASEAVMGSEKCTDSAMEATSVSGDSSSSSSSSSSSASSEPPPSDGMVPGAKVRTEFGDVGTVRFRGTAAFREGDWVGVELTRPKGKNSGSVQGVQYFACAPNHGLFSRPNKLTLLPADYDLQADAAAAAARLPRSMSAVEISDDTAVDARSAATSGGRSEPPSARASPGVMRPAPPSLRAVSAGGAGSLEYALGYSPYPERQVPPGWVQAWGAKVDPSTAEAVASRGSCGGDGSGGGSGGPVAAAERRLPGGPVGDDASLALPVVLYVSSLAGDRRQSKNCRWTMDFLVGKKVPHAVVDLSVHPQLRGQLVASIAAAGVPSLPPPAAGAKDDDGAAAREAREAREAQLLFATRRAEELLAQLPLIDLDGRRMVSKGELQDMEDHAELDPILRQAIRKFASTPSPALEAAIKLAPR